MPSLTEENYLKAIFFLNTDSEEKASTNAIAMKMATKASSVSDMLKKLKEKKLINYKKYKAVTLTEEGERIAVSIIRKHRLWEFFLVEKLGFGWEEVHDLAEQLEHIQSPDLTNRLEAFLDFPKMDPHGDPIPDKNGRFPLVLNEVLFDCKEGVEVSVIGVKNHAPEFLSFLDQMQIQLGTLIEIKKINSFDQSRIIIVNKQSEYQISKEVAQNLFINALHNE